MKQYEAVIATMERLGGVATLGELYIETLKIKECDWKTKTPFASIRRIVQLTKEIYKIKPGLYGLEKLRSEIEQRGIMADTESPVISDESIRFTHTYYQSLLVKIGNIRNLDTFVPKQDKKKETYDGHRLGELSSLDSLPPYSYPATVARSSTIDTIWMNERKMPHSFFEVEHTTDMQNSLLKFDDLIDFSARMIIVADEKRKPEFNKKFGYTGFKCLREKGQVGFLSYGSLVRQYEREIENRKEELLV